MMKLATMPNTTGSSVGSWRHPLAYGKTVMRLEQAIELAQIAERGCLDAIFYADGNAVPNQDRKDLFEALTPSDRPAAFEPVTLLSALSQHTSHVGLVATATTTYEAPYTLARKFASLDHLSGGRAGWNMVTSASTANSRNFGQDELMDHNTRYERADEFVNVCKGLWDSWADDAFPQNKETGQYLRADRVRAINHEGKFLKVKGPLNVARPPQGYPSLFSAGQSEDGRNFAAKHAECLFAVATTKEEGIALTTDLRNRAEALGRARDQIKVLPGAGIYVGETREEAQRMYDEVSALIPVNIGLSYLERMMGMDLKGYDLDAPMPPLVETEVQGLVSIRRSVSEYAAEKGLTLRQTYEHSVIASGQVVWVGTASDIVDQMESWYLGGACDGFVVKTPIAPYGLKRFVDLVVPELQRRGLFRKKYESNTLRGNLGLNMPANSLF